VERFNFTKVLSALHEKRVNGRLNMIRLNSVKGRKTVADQKWIRVWHWKSETLCVLKNDLCLLNELQDAEVGMVEPEEKGSE
jgi:hypothetical protein